MNDVIKQWNDSAQKYTADQEQSEFVQSNKNVVMKRFCNLNHEKALDLGCGYGFYTNYFKSIGADTIGIDGSEAMINLACQHYPDCDFMVADITKRIDFSDTTFDIIFCNQVLMDIENIEPVFSECSRLLKDGGIFYYSIVHPAFYDGMWLQDKTGYNFAKSVEKYITPYILTNEFWGKTTHFHRPLSHYLNAASKNGLFLLNTEEPVSYDGQTKNCDIPLFFFAEYKKISM